MNGTDGRINPNADGSVIEDRRVESRETPPEPAGDGFREAPIVPEPRLASEPDDRAPAPPQFREDTRRNEIAARFRKNRIPSVEDDDAAEIRRFANQGLPPEMVQDDVRTAPEDQDDRAPPVETTPQKHRIKVRGQEIELTTDELIARAQKVEAADDYFNEAKQQLQRNNEQSRELDERIRRADDILRNSGQRPHDAQPQGTETAPADVQPQDNLFTKLAKDIVYGEPEEAGQAIATTVQSVARHEIRQEIDSGNQRNELARNQRFISSFKQEHPDIDETAEAAITSKLFAAQRDDLVKLAPQLGIKPEQVPTDQRAIAQWHLAYRARGMPVQSVEDMTKNAYGDFVNWEKKRGRRTDDQPRQDDDTRPAPRVKVEVNRDERRLSIPQQPTRSTVPVSTVQPVQPQSRSQVAQNMIRTRQQQRGKITA